MRSSRTLDQVFRARNVLWLVGLQVTGCASTDVEELNNDGEVCVRGFADRSLTLQVTFDRCYSSSCSDPIATRCAILLDGNDIQVESYARVELWDGACTSDCHRYGATCSIDGVSVGTYLISHGERQTTLRLTSDGPSLGIAGDVSAGLLCAGSL